MSANLFDVETKQDEGDPAGYQTPYARVGPLVGASALGASVYVLNEGQSVCPYHWEAGDEEWLLVLEGRPELRTPEGEEELEPGDLVCFPKGPDGAHKVTNRLSEVARIVILSTKNEPGVSVYPDSNKVGAWPPGKLFRLDDAVDYWEGEILTDVFNLFANEAWDRENDRDGYRHRATAIGQRLGASLLGGALYELDPGESTWPYHYEQGCDELAIVVSGSATLRTPDGERELAPGDIAKFVEGPEGAHGIANRSDEPCRVLILSSKSPLAVVHYPDSKKVGIWSQAGGYEHMLHTEPELDYWEGE